MNIAGIVENINAILNSASMPAPKLPPILLTALSVKRTGLSAYKIATKVIENNKLLGIPTEPNEDGTDNVINQYTYNLVKCIVEALKNEASIQVSIPMNSLLIQATGGNAGGPVTCVGTNIIDSLAQGIIQ